MNKKSIVSALVFAFVTLLSLGPVNQAQSADLSPGEGGYVGAFLGFGAGVLQSKVVGRTINEQTTRTLNFETDRGGLGLEGIQGGGWLGYGLKTADDLYVGFDITGMASDEQIKLTTDAIHAEDEAENEATGTAITSITAKRKWSAGGALRVGYYINPDTLFALKGGIAVSEIETTMGGKTKDYYAGGPQFGGSIDARLSKIDPNLSIRMEAVITDYLTADILGGGDDGVGRTTGDTGYDAELTGVDVAARIGVTYNFDLGLPSLF